MTFAEEKTNTSLGQNTLFHGETLLVVSTGDTENVTSPFVTESGGIDLLAHTLLVKRTNLSKEKYITIRNSQQ